MQPGMVEDNRAVRAPRLPREVHESDLSLIFEKLPVLVLWQARATCRVWRNAASADNRMAEVLKRRQSARRSSMFVQVIHRGGECHDLRSPKYALAHDPVRNAWCPTLMFWHWGFHVARRRKVAFEGTAGGLVFFHDGQSALLETKLQVLVTNPLTKKIKELPVLHHHMRKDAEVRVVPAEDGGYSLVAVLAHWCPVERDRTSVYVFHSRKENWFNGAPFPRRILSEVTLGPSLNGSIYCYEGQQGSLTIWRFNLKENKWSEVSIPAEVMQNLVSYQLVEQWGRLLMFAGCGEFTEAIKQLEGIKVWEVSVVNSTIERPSFSPDVESTGKSFAETTYRWNMLGEMEHKFFRDFCNSFGYGKRGQTPVLASLKFIHLVAADHCIYLSSKSSKFLPDSAAPLKNVALFDTLDRSWSWLTRPEVVLPYGYSSFCEAMSFVPRKTAVP